MFITGFGAVCCCWMGWVVGILEYDCIVVAISHVDKHETR